jgi:phospholipid/cholesterol/gamma-HCH transport system substrate-binding protein
VSLLSAPARAVATVRGFVAPKLTAGRVPWGRTVLVIQLIGALAFVGYTLAKKSIRMPFAAEPYVIEVILPDAKGLDELDEPAAAVAGSPVGRVSEVRYEDGEAIATLRLDAEVRGRIFADASVSLRPASALQNLTVNVDAGTPAAGPLPDGVPIPPNRTEAFVTVDELTSVLDADTQAMAQILIAEAERALRGREPELRRSLGELGELTETAKPIAAALDSRRELLAELVGDLDVILTTTALRGRQLTRVIETGSDTLAVTAGRERELERAVRILAPTLERARSALEASRRLADPLAAGIDPLLPVADELPPAASELRELLPRAERLLAVSDRLTRAGARPVSLLVRGTRDLPSDARSLIPTVDDLHTRARLLDRYRGGFAQLADTLSGAFSVNDNGGTFAQIDNVLFETPRPENLGFPEGATGRDGELPTELSVSIAEALERTCRTENTAACLFRYTVPGLPREPELGGGG